MKVDINIPDSVSGDWRIETFTVDENDLSQKLSAIKYGRSVPSGTYKALKRNGTTVMSNTPDEIHDFMYFFYKATGSVLVNGLGLGVLLKALLTKLEISDITVIENSPDVIKLVGGHCQDERVEIIQADAFQFQPPKGKRYNAVWHDIWDFICADNLPEMHRLHRKYGKRADFQASWCRMQCERQNNHRW